MPVIGTKNIVAKVLETAGDKITKGVTPKEQMIDYIGKLKLTREQKRAIYLSMGYSEKLVRGKNELVAVYV